MRPLVLFLFAPGLARAAPVFHGPLPYVELDDSPLDVDAGSFEVEDFEDGTLDLTGTTWEADADAWLPASERWWDAIDSVDGDDGAVDGLCSGCDSMWVDAGTLTVRFDEEALGGLPTQAGLVWTDGFGEVVFEAFGADGGSLGTIVFAAGLLDDYLDDPDEDRFVGVSDPEGISAIAIGHQQGTEVDHVQLGLPDIDEDDDGIADEVDLCEDSEDAVDDDGCSIDQLVPCDDAWRCHGDYVRSIARTVRIFVDQGWLTRREGAAIVSAAARSDCGR